MAETGVRAQGWKGWLDKEVYADYLILIKGSLGELSNFALSQHSV